MHLAGKLMGFAGELASLCLGLPRESPGLVCQDSKERQVSQALLAHLGRRGTSGDQAFLESMEPSGPPAFRESEVTSYK